MLMTRLSQDTGCSSYKAAGFSTIAGFSSTFVSVCHKQGCFKFRVRKTTYFFPYFVYSFFMNLLPYCCVLIPT